MNQNQYKRKVAVAKNILHNAQHHQTYSPYKKSLYISQHHSSLLLSMNEMENTNPDEEYRRG
jgi:hypothetical protein